MALSRLNALTWLASAASQLAPASLFLASERLKVSFQNFKQSINQDSLAIKKLGWGLLLAFADEIQHE